MGDMKSFVSKARGLKRTLELKRDDKAREIIDESEKDIEEGKIKKLSDLD